MIPEDALEEAAKVLAFHLTDRAQDAGCALRCGYDGEEMPAHLAQHILEAAAPHMLAQPIPNDARECRYCGPDCDA